MGPVGIHTRRSAAKSHHPPVTRRNLRFVLLECDIRLMHGLPVVRRGLVGRTEQDVRCFIKAAGPASRYLRRVASILLATAAGVQWGRPLRGLPSGGNQTGFVGQHDGLDAVT